MELPTHPRGGCVKRPSRRWGPKLLRAPVVCSPMRAHFVTGRGIGGIELRRVPDPVPGPGEVARAGRGTVSELP